MELLDRVDRLEMKERVNKLLVDSPAIDSMPDADFKAKMTTLLSTELKLPPATLAHYTYRKIGKQGRKRALITLRSTEDRAQFFAAARTLKPANLYINEALTPAKSRLLYEIRQFKKNSSTPFYVYTHFGEIFVKLDRNSNPVKVVNLEQVKDVLASKK